MSVELVVTTSSPTDPSTAQYDETFGQVLKDYEKLMGQDHKPTNFESDKAVLEVLGKTVHRFEDYIDGNQRLKTWLESYVDLLFTVSATLWENTEVVSLTHDDSLLPCYCTLTSLSVSIPLQSKRSVTL